MQFDSMAVNFDRKSLTKEHPFMPEGRLEYYYLFENPEELHYHDFLELGYCVSGSGLFYIDGEAIPFSAPCFSIIYGGQIHIAQSVSKERSLWHFSYVNLKSLFTDTNLIAVEGVKAMSSHLYEFPALLRQQDDPFLYDLVVGILNEAAEMKEGYLTAIRGLMVALLTRHSRYMVPAACIRKNQEQVLERLGSTLVYINQHYMHDISIDDLIQASGLSKSTLQRDMIAFTGMAPMQYIHHLRMKRATILLMKKLPITDVAFNVGYNVLSSFNRHFHQTFGISPTQWRKQHGETVTMGR